MDRAAHRGAPHPFSNSSNHDRSHHNNSFIDQRVRFAEGGDSSQGPKVYQPTPRRASSAAVSAVASSAALPVYWDDKGTGREGDQGSDANLAGYTFYRERTPTPPEYEGSEKRHHGGGRGSLVPPGSGIETSTVGGGTIRSHDTSTAGGDYSMRRLHLTDGASWGHPDNNNRTPLKKTRRFWVVVVIGILMLIGIGLGVGLALGLPKNHEATADAAGPPARSVYNPSYFDAEASKSLTYPAVTVQPRPQLLHPPHPQQAQHLVARQPLQAIRGLHTTQTARR